jgi:hypothetical protein
MAGQTFGGVKLARVKSQNISNKKQTSTRKRDNISQRLLVRFRFTISYQSNRQLDRDTIIVGLTED